MFPFINGDKLYFSSNGHPGLGGLDIYEATFDEENGFSTVKNIGMPMNHFFIMWHMYLVDDIMAVLGSSITPLPKTIDHVIGNPNALTSGC